jgi:hypothetical protein
MKCPRCGVTIAEENLAMPNRCPDWRCPTMPDELRRATQLSELKQESKCTGQ